MKKKEPVSPISNATSREKERDKKKRKLHIINLDFITERLSKENSLIDHIASLYGNRNLLIKLAEASGLLGGATLLGALLGQAIVFGLLISLIYIPCALVLSNHYASMVKKNERLHEDLVHLRKNQEASVDQLYEIEEKLDESVTLCAEKTEVLSQKTAAIEEQTCRINEETSHLIETREELHQTNAELAECAEKLETTIHKAQSTFETCEPTLIEKSRTLQNLYHQSTITNQTLQKNHEQLTELSAHLSSAHARLSIFSTEARNTLGRLQKELAKKETSEKRDTRQVSPEPIDSPHRLTMKKMIATAKSAIEQSKKQREHNIKSTTESSYKTRLQLAEEEALIQRALNVSLRMKVPHVSAHVLTTF